MSIEELPPDFYYTKIVIKLKEAKIGIQVDDIKLQAWVKNLNLDYQGNFSGKKVMISLANM